MSNTENNSNHESINIVTQNNVDSITVHSKESSFSGNVRAENDGNALIPATPDKIGMVKPGANLSVEIDGTLNADTYSKTQIDNFLLTKADSTSIPENISELNNDLDFVTQSDLENGLSEKQAVLESGTNIKTINNESILGSGNITIESGSDITVDDTLSTTSTNPVQNNIITAELNNKATQNLSNVENYLPVGTTITVGTSGADYTTLEDAFSYIEGKWSDGWVTISIITDLTTTDSISLNTSTFNFPMLHINGNNHTITMNFTTSGTYSCGLQVLRTSPIIITDTSFVGATNGTTHILVGGYYTTSFLVSNCSFDNAYAGLLAYNVANVTFEGCKFYALSNGVQAQQGGTAVGRANTFGASGKKCTNCHVVYLGGFVRDSECIYTNYSNQASPTSGSITSAGLIMLV